MKLSYSLLIWILILFIPFESVILSNIPLPTSIYAASLYLHELFIYMMFGLVLFQRITREGWLNKTPIDWLLIAFICLGAFSTLANRAPVVDAMVNMRALLRYFALFYVVVNVEISPIAVRRFYRSLVAIAIFEVLVASFQHFVTSPGFLLPRDSEIAIAGKTVDLKIISQSFSGGREVGSANATFADTIYLALFFIVIFTWILSQLSGFHKFHFHRKLWQIFTLGFIAIGLMFTYSRASFLAALVAVPVFLVLSSKIRSLVIISLLSFISIVTAVLVIKLADESQVKSNADKFINPRIAYSNPLENIAASFSSEYYETASSNSRGKFIVQIGTVILKSLNLYGYSPAQDFAKEKLAEKADLGIAAVIINASIDDVYWMAMVIYYGWLGLFLFWMILLRLFIAARYVQRHSPTGILKNTALTLATLIVISMPLTMIIRLWQFRSFAIFFWLLAGIVVAEYIRIKKEKKKAELLLVVTQVS